MLEPRRYRSRPVEVTAIQWTGDNADAIRAWITGRNANALRAWIAYGSFTRWRLWVAKSNAWCDIEVGDWIVAEPDGDGHYPVKAAVFADRYQPVSEQGVHLPTRPLAVVDTDDGDLIPTTFVSMDAQSPDSSGATVTGRPEVPAGPAALDGKGGTGG